MATQYSGYGYPGRINRWQDWINLAPAVWLFISPWVLQFGAATQAAGTANGPAVAVSHAAWNAWVLGVIVFLVALSAIGSWEMWQEWWCLILGAWIFVAPWVLGFVGLRRASWDHWLVGAVIFLLALWGLSRSRNAPIATVPPAADRQPPPHGLR